MPRAKSVKKQAETAVSEPADPTPNGNDTHENASAGSAVEAIAPAKGKARSRKAPKATAAGEVAENAPEVGEEKPLPAAARGKKKQPKDTDAENAEAKPKGRGKKVSAEGEQKVDPPAAKASKSRTKKEPTPLQRRRHRRHRQGVDLSARRRLLSRSQKQGDASERSLRQKPTVDCRREAQQSHQSDGPRRNHPNRRSKRRQNQGQPPRPSLKKLSQLPSGYVHPRDWLTRKSPLPWKRRTRERRNQKQKISEPGSRRLYNPNPRLPGVPR